MFYNYSNLSESHIDFTRETYRLLTGFSGLKLVSGYSKDTDAVLIAILKSPEKVMDTIRATNPRLAQEKAKESIGDKRQDFYIPGTSNVLIYLHVIVIKKPTDEELNLLRSGIGDQIKMTSKVIFNELMPLNAQYTREVLDRKGTEVVGTQNIGVQRKVLKGIAEQAAVNIKDMILYAF